MTLFPSRRFSAGYRYPRYSRRRGGALWWILLALGLLGSAGAAYDHFHGGPADGPAKYIIAASGTANEPRPGLPGDLAQELRSAGQSSTAATAYVLNPGTGVA